MKSNIDTGCNLAVHCFSRFLSAFRSSSKISVNLNSCNKKNPEKLPAALAAGSSTSLDIGSISNRKMQLYEELYLMRT